MPARLARPRRRREVWLHVDTFNKPNDYVWAVQYWNGKKWVYRTAEFVGFEGYGFTSFRGRRVRQPLGIVRFLPASVRWQGRSTAVIKA